MFRVFMSYTFISTHHEIQIYGNVSELGLIFLSLSTHGQLMLRNKLLINPGFTDTSIQVDLWRKERQVHEVGIHSLLTPPCCVLARRDAAAQQREEPTLASTKAAVAAAVSQCPSAHGRRGPSQNHHAGEKLSFQLRRGSSTSIHLTKNYLNWVPRQVWFFIFFFLKKTPLPSLEVQLEHKQGTRSFKT